MEGCLGSGVDEGSWGDEVFCRCPLGFRFFDRFRLYDVYFVISNRFRIVHVRLYRILIILDTY